MRQKDRCEIKGVSPGGRETQRLRGLLLATSLVFRREHQLAFQVDGQVGFWGGAIPDSSPPCGTPRGVQDKQVSERLIDVRLPCSTTPILVKARAGFPRKRHRRIEHKLNSRSVFTFL